MITDRNMIKTFLNQAIEIKQAPQTKLSHIPPCAEPEEFVRKIQETYRNGDRQVHERIGTNDPLQCSLSHINTLTVSLLCTNLLDSPFVFISKIFCLISNEINIYILNKSSKGEGGILHRMSVTFWHCCFTSCIRFICLLS